MKERVQFLSKARIIGILLVVLGHSYPFNVYIPGPLEQLRGFVYSFHMPLFIFISGYLAMRNEDEPAGYVKKRAMRLLIPYLGLSLIAYIPKVLVQGFLNDSVEFSFWYLLRSELVPRDNVWGHFWYIPVVFLFGVFSAFVGKPLGKNKRIMAAVLVGSFAVLFFPQTTNWFALEDMRQTFFYYVLGMATSQFGEKIFLSKLWLFGLLVSWLVYANCPAALTCVTAVMMCGFILHMGTYGRKQLNPIAHTIERSSYCIYLLSWPAQAVVEIITNRILHLPLMLCMVSMFAAGLLVPLMCCEVVRKLEKRVPMGWFKILVGM